MKCAQIMFSPTGGTQKAASAITEAWDAAIETIDLTDASADFSQTVFREEDLVLAAVPSYAGRVPGLAAQRLAQIHGGGARCVLVCVYGNRAYEDTLIELKDLAEACGFRILAAVAAVAEHSVIHQYAAGRPDQQDREALRACGERIWAKFKDTGGETAALQIPGSRPYKKAGAVAMVPKAGNACVGCGVCADRCPAQAIRRESVQTADPKRCISCMRCVVLCPHKARDVNGALASAIALKIKKACSVRKECELFL